MCGIIGFTSDNVTKQDLSVLRRALIESKIRGKHASGVAWCNFKGDILSIVKPESIDKLMEEIDLGTMVYNGKISMIAHARYSTSDIRFNQPIIGDKLAIAHNGVVTQSPPETWKKTYKYKCKTCNDSELLLRALESGDDFSVFKGASIAAVMLDNTGGLSSYRNGLRPLYTGRVGKGIIYGSTFDILNRAGVKDIRKLQPLGELEERQYRSNQYENR